MTDQHEGVKSATAVAAYAPPQLTVYGDLVKLTAGGSGVSNEGGDPGNLAKHP